MIQQMMLVLGALCALFGLYFAAIAILGNLKPIRKIPSAVSRYRIAALIPARNEEGVVARLVESLKQQHYPDELYDIYVIPNNCTDHTQEDALRAGARVLSCEQEVHSKGEVLRFAFNALLQADQKYDAYCIFDADNLVDANFMQAANNALAAGYEVCQGYRDSKNPADNWVSSCTSVFFWFMNRLYNRARFALGMSASLNGTGLVLAAGLIERMGWNTGTLTEDLEFTAQCALADVKIAWLQDAVIYDEQPTTLKDSFVQRRRWGAGSFQCFKRYFIPLMRHAFFHQSMDALDIGLIFLGVPTQLIGLASGALTLLECWLRAVRDPMLGLMHTLALAGIAWLVLFGVGVVFVLLICLLERKLLQRRARIVCALTMWLYLLTWMPANLMCLVTRPPQWTYIRHVRSVSIEQCDAGRKESDAL